MSTHNWKAAGPDKIQNFWYKKLTSTHEHLAKQITDVINNPDTFPDFLTEGITYIQPKSHDTKNPSNYRPITCLPTLYKIISKVICQNIEQHLELNQILTEEQNVVVKAAGAVRNN